MAKAKTAKPRKLTSAQVLLLEQFEPWTRGSSRFRVEPEARVSASRRWRIDVAIYELAWDSAYLPLLAVEIDGGAYIRGRHTRGAGVEADNEKIAALAALGWRFIRVTPKQVLNGTALRWIKEAL